jgi:hypothetical protein
MKMLKDYTLKDALNDYANGFVVICSDGQARCVTNMPEYGGEDDCFKEMD